MRRYSSALEGRIAEIYPFGGYGLAAAAKPKPTVEQYTHHFRYLEAGVFAKALDPMVRRCAILGWSYTATFPKIWF
jgi:hypothetical protein